MLNKRIGELGKEEGNSGAKLDTDVTAHQAKLITKRDKLGERGGKSTRKMRGESGVVGKQTNIGKENHKKKTKTKEEKKRD